MHKPKYRIGLALSGGSTRGVAHVGVLKALIENDFEPQILSGTSAGSIVGTLYAAGKTPDEILKFIKQSSLFRVFRPGFPFTGFSDLSYLHERLESFIGEDSFEALKKPIYIICTNLNTGEEVRFFKGSLFKKVVASCSVPLVFKPVEIDGELYADGGIMNNLPSECLRKQCELVIGSNVVPLRFKSSRSLGTVWGIAQRIFELAPSVNVRQSSRFCDVLIEPTDINQFNFFSLEKTDHLFQKGYEATIHQIPYIKKLLESKLH
ncbi:MAG: patatin-like phospholipase family protein [Saprospiraceae bacterium]